MYEDTNICVVSFPVLESGPSPASSVSEDHFPLMWVGIAAGGIFLIFLVVAFRLILLRRCEQCVHETSYDICSSVPKCRMWIRTIDAIFGQRACAFSISYSKCFV